MLTALTVAPHEERSCLVSKFIYFPNCQVLYFLQLWNGKGQGKKQLPHKSFDTGLHLRGFVTTSVVGGRWSPGYSLGVAGRTRKKKGLGADKQPVVSLFGILERR